jgi:hypothetical protein
MSSIQSTKGAPGEYEGGNEGSGPTAQIERRLPVFYIKILDYCCNALACLFCDLPGVTRLLRHTITQRWINKHRSGEVAATLQSSSSSTDAAAEDGLNLCARLKIMCHFTDRRCVRMNQSHMSRESLVRSLTGRRVILWGMSMVHKRCSESSESSSVTLAHSLLMHDHC